MNKKNPTIISITGTKGKTTIARLLEEVYTKSKRETLLVDTHGHYLNQKRKSTDKDSLKTFGIIPTVCPGRFLYEIKNKSNSVAILETSIGSSGPAGIGYKSHDIGIITNIFEDHIGRRIKTKESLARKKGYIFRQVKTDGVLVFNADDPYINKIVMERSKKRIQKRNIELIPVGFDFSNFKIKKHLKKGGEAITKKGNHLILISSKKETKLMNLSYVEWTFWGKYEPAVINLMLTIACLYKEQKKFTLKTKKILEKYKPSEKNYGRLLCYKNKKRNLSVIVDYAHEKNSIKAIGSLAQNISKNKTIGIVCFNPDRTDEQIKNYALETSNIFDVTIIYDKIDGINRKPEKDKRKIYYRNIGETSNIIYKKMKVHTLKPNKVYKKIQEKEAIEKAFKISDKNDVIIHVFGNDGLKSIEMLKNTMDLKRCSNKEVVKS